MTTAYDFHLFYLPEIICLNNFPEFLSFIHMTSKLSILSNHAKYPKELALYYMLSFFTSLKSLHSIDQLACLKKMTSIGERGCLVQKSWASEASISPSFHRSDHKNQDHKDSLKSNKPLARLPKAFARPFQALRPKVFEIDIVRFT